MDTLVASILGKPMSAESRVWTALGPALLLMAYFLVGLLIYSMRYLSRGAFRDPEMEARGETKLTSRYFRLYFAWIIQPLIRLALWTGVPASAITTLSVLLATASGVGLSVGRFALGGWLYIIAGILDVLDGRIARARKSASKSGAALDSILDRYSDSAVLVGLSWYYRDSWVLLVAQLALVGSSLVPYIRARGEASGLVMKDVGLMQRAERILYLGAAVALSPIVEVWLDPNDPHPLHRVAIVGVLLLAVTTQVTALQRFVHLLDALDGTIRTSWLRSGRGSLFRNLVAAVVATVVDFALLVVLVTSAHVHPSVATACGCIIGAGVNFSINHLWAFWGNSKRLPQIKRYGFVSLTSALLNFGGVAVMLLIPAIDYRLAWLLVRVAVFVGWNKPLQGDYVFADEEKSVA